MNASQLNEWLFDRQPKVQGNERLIAFNKFMLAKFGDSHPYNSKIRDKKVEVQHAVTGIDQEIVTTVYDEFVSSFQDSKLQRQHQPQVSISGTLGAPPPQHQRLQIGLTTYVDTCEAAFRCLALTHMQDALDQGTYEQYLDTAFIEFQARRPIHADIRLRLAPASYARPCHSMPLGQSAEDSDGDEVNS